MDRQSKINFSEINRICDKIELVLQRRKNLNLSAKLKDFDYKNCGLISDTKFFNVISCQLGEELGLSETEARKLTKFFRNDDGRVDYIKFLEKIDFDEFNQNGFVSGFEWDDPNHVNVLSSMELRTLKLIITKIAYLSKFSSSLLWLEPLFDDYKTRARNGSMTTALFKKVLYQAGITLGEKEFNVVVKRYAKYNYTVNYVAFMKDVQKMEKWLDDNKEIVEKSKDDLMPGKILTVNIDKLPRPEIGSFDVAENFQLLKCGHPILERNKTPTCREVNEILSKIKRIVNIKGINAKQFFSDFDTFNSGYITKSQFHIGLEAMGISGLHGQTLTADEFELLLSKYQENWDDRYIERVKWRMFCEDVSNAHEIDNHFKLVEVPSNVRLRESVNSAELAQSVMMKIRKVVKTYKIAIETYFKSFDKLNRCHVSPMQMRRVLASHSILLNEEEYRALLARYRNDIGFNYRKFLQELDETCWCGDDDDDTREHSKSSTSKARALPEKSGESVIEILAKVRNEIMRKRTSLGQFMSMRYLRRGLVSRDQFKSSFASAGIIMSECELETLCKT